MVKRIELISMSRYWPTVVALLLPMVIYAVLLGLYSVNAPFGDDYVLFLRHLNLPDSDHLAHLFAQHNEHRLAFVCGVGELSYLLSGSVNFIGLILFGNLALLGIAWRLWRYFQRFALPAGYFVPVMLLLFIHPAWENMTWATGSIQNYFVLLFAMLALYYFADLPQRLSWALFWAVVALLTSGSGLVLLPLMLCWLLLDRGEARSFSQIRIALSAEKGRAIGLLVAVTTVVPVLYFYDHTVPPHHQSAFQISFNPLQFIGYFLALLGSLAPVKPFAIAIGAGLLGLFGYLTRQKVYRSDPFLYLLLLFVLANNLLITLARYSFGIDQALSFRYSVVSVLFVVVSYLLLLRQQWFLALLQQPLWRRLGWGGLLLYALLATGLNLYFLEKRQQQLLQSIALRESETPAFVLHSQSIARDILNQAAQKGIYRMDSVTP
ncbi:hypothetical protein D5085_11040 [Ectothiorhodospiraceae bacterium BW-2]|nr:hypothetical protein D5085_11040 [Ectothiorhodospiraceae bacterium BW-2]